MTFGYSCREATPCFGCDLPMERCVCDVTVCPKCDQTIDDYGYCHCKSDNGLSMEEVEARIARFVNPGTSLVEVETLEPRDGRERRAA
jgi:hypothetical protein